MSQIIFLCSQTYVTSKKRVVCCKSKRTDRKTVSTVIRLGKVFTQPTVQVIFTNFEFFINNRFERNPQTLNSNICFEIPPTLFCLVLLEAGGKWAMCLEIVEFIISRQSPCGNEGKQTDVKWYVVHWCAGLARCPAQLWPGFSAKTRYTCGIQHHIINDTLPCSDLL